MTEDGNIEELKAIWIALSELYVDTQLQPSDFKKLAKCIYESPFSYEDVREINRITVFPVLYPNLLSVAGVWTGFDEKWLVASILKKKEKRNFPSRTYYAFLYYCMKGMFKEDWRILETQLQKLEKND